MALAFLCSGWAATQQPAGPSQTAKAISEQLHQLSSLPDDARAGVTKKIARQIRKLPQGMERSGSKLGLAQDLANLAADGDFGRDTLQEVTTTLELALGEVPLGAGQRRPDEPYLELASLARYEHLQAGLNDRQYAAAMAKLESGDQARREADFTLADLEGSRGP